VAILRPFIDQEVDRSTLERLAQSYPELDIPSVETCLAFLHSAMLRAKSPNQADVITYKQNQC
jgi:hypothetical protein